MAAPARRRKLIGHRRRVEDEGEDDGAPDHYDLDDDSLTDGSLASDDADPADGSDTSNVDEASPTAPAVGKLGDRPAKRNGNSKAAHSKSSKTPGKTVKSADSAVTDTDFMMNGLSINDREAPVQEMHFDDTAEPEPAPAPKTAAPIVVSSSSVADASQSTFGGDRRRREHDEYRRKRDEDPSFVPNRGAFFMHDHRHAGPSANGFRPFGRGSRGRGRGGIGGPFAPMSHPLHNPADPTTNAPWAHDMHEVVVQPPPVRQPRSSFVDDGPPNGDGIIPTCPPSSTPINRRMSTEKIIGNVHIRVYVPSLMKEPVIFSGIPMKQYTKLPDHRPPLRRDKPVRISLPDFPHRYVFPATDRSFIFIPRAMRPNQRLRGKPRSGLGSIGGFSRRTSVFGGSVYAGSAYSPSIAMSRRSSIAPDLGRDFIVSPTGSTMSRPPLPYDAARPVVRLPPQGRPDQHQPIPDGGPVERPFIPVQQTINNIPQPQIHPLPQKPSYQESMPAPIPMHQPRPQKTVSVADIETPEIQQNHSQSYQQAFHQQVPVQVSNGLGPETHARHPSYPSQHSTGTPLSQIPERAIHAAVFQPNQYAQQSYYPSYQMMQPHQAYYFPPAPTYPGAMPPPGSTPAFIPGVQQAQPLAETTPSQTDSQNPSNSHLVQQEVNGTVYYYDASQLPPVQFPPHFPAAQGYPMPAGVVGMNGMVTPSPDGYYYPPPASGVVYYGQ
ncbi:hypothetical protein F4778DRAFT_588105 [Xylariomycetidae sp. FL2044]|nr:hypothetical protein F4778DRAFT_588105 [Xylariomycetidae sp. FL2044]